MNFMSSMVGPMGGHTVQGMRAGQPAAAGMGMANGGPALSDAYGPSMGRAMGEQTSMERAVGTGPRDRLGHGGEHARDGDALERPWARPRRHRGAASPAIRKG